MYRPLELPAPLAWVESLPAKRWDHRSRSWVFPPKGAKAIASAWESHVYSLMLSDALRWLNSDWALNDDTHADLTNWLRRRIHSAGLRAGAAWLDRSNADGILHGNLSLHWLDRTASAVASRAMEHWNPTEADRIRAAARKGGQNSKRSPLYSPSDLVHGSVTAQAEALGVSRSTIARLRRQSRAEGSR